MIEDARDEDVNYYGNVLWPRVVLLGYTDKNDVVITKKSTITR